MYLWVSNKKKNMEKINFFGILKVAEERSLIWIRIRIQVH